MMYQAWCYETRVVKVLCEVEAADPSQALELLALGDSDILYEETYETRDRDIGDLIDDLDK